MIVLSVAGIFAFVSLLFSAYQRGRNVECQRWCQAIEATRHYESEAVRAKVREILRYMMVHG